MNEPRSAGAPSRRAAVAALLLAAAMTTLAASGPSAQALPAAAAHLQQRAPAHHLPRAPAHRQPASAHRQPRAPGLHPAAPRTPPPGPPALDVQPFPGTPDVSPQTDVGFPALRPGQIRTLRVTGSRSGRHLGRLTELPGGGGAAFIPARPFAPGERVTVQATLSSPAAGTATGDPGATRIGFSFGVAVAAPPALAARALRAAALEDLAPDAAGSTAAATGPTSAAPGSPAAATAAAGPTAAAAAAPFPGAEAHPAATALQLFYSEPWLHPPVAYVSGTDPDPGQGDIFGDIENSVQVGPLILDPQGRLVYFQPLHHAVAFDVSVQRYQGQPVLTYWRGPAIDYGREVILNQHYQQIASVRAGHGDYADAHEFQITPQGNALISVYAPVRADLSALGGPRHGLLMDSIVQEINIATGQVIWEWHASGHVALTSTYAGRPGTTLPYDFFHINSIQQLPGDRLLISGRNTWSLYEISMRTGRILLVIGGKHSWLHMGPGTNFEWQHHARMQPDGTITVFDNASDGPFSDEPQSRALRIRLDLPHRRATLVHAWTDNPPLLSSSQGSVQPLGDGNTFIGWGANAYFTEFGRTGAELFSVHFPLPVASYRGLRFPWSGQPLTPPWAAATPTPRGTRVYASWNGATTVAAWRVLAGPSAGSLLPVGTFRRTGFETRMWVPSTAAEFAVQALGSSGQVLGTSAAVAR